ncbi:hypothetical protein L6164_037601 [Bauhinia variegata]|uniref:Uncharacterized protein n=1 Tax=Bauhinia variegata TaxID=167791 RepID=A0ACB9KKJ1_BAUVA|nr:hypothetical protein L6164_037601 [Bauhinia variegata]
MERKGRKVKMKMRPLPSKSLQPNYLEKTNPINFCVTLSNDFFSNFMFQALDTFNAAIVSPVYYVMFTTLTIIASAIMFEDWSGQDMRSIASEICGFITVLSGTTLLHATRDQEQADMQGRLLLIRMLGSYPFVTILVLLSIGTKSEVKFYFRYRTLTWYIGDDSTKGPEDEH